MWIYSIWAEILFPVLTQAVRGFLLMEKGGEMMISAFIL